MMILRENKNSIDWHNKLQISYKTKEETQILDQLKKLKKLFNQVQSNKLYLLGMRLKKNLKLKERKYNK